MIRSQDFLDRASQWGFNCYTGVPCSYLQPLINGAMSSPHLRYITAANEGDAVAIASGMELASQRCIVMMQNSGLGNAVNPLTSLNIPFQIPILLIITWRGQPQGDRDEPQHQLMGKITPHLLDLMTIPWQYFPAETQQIAPTFSRIINHFQQQQTPYALIMPKGVVEATPLTATISPKIPSLTPATATLTALPSWTRREVLQAILSATQPTDILLTTTGYTGRELYNLADRDNQLYLVGSMGCASSVGLGMAIAHPQKRIIILDGDGAALMRLGAWAAIGCERPANLVHILLDNRCHESTGGQPTVSASLNFSAIAEACGYEKVVRVETPPVLSQNLQSPTSQLTFLHIPVQPGTAKSLPRPHISPSAAAQRLRQYLHQPNSCYS
ncbi:MAG: phosphonopyruvate decarboxylase [Jaaginema sp. PMC 1079.18]|nr:phosphonopyruvate decarboxylase [Jaaginema sp. PMC 1080.18]MEC4851869.1 phosphonopyruvate decarboxylase [Jaaginema sp. PMC 1079.18]MEC4866433.1 phosphonopyruvate decarboxylase [Jaaginema sp. PMC 1078.18]